MAIEALKARITELALAAAADQGFALAGGNALAAHGLLSRPTEDVDLFTPQAGGPGRVLEAIQTALTGDGFQVRLLPATPLFSSQTVRPGSAGLSCRWACRQDARIVSANPARGVL